MKIKTSIENLKNYKVFLEVEKATNEFLQKKGYLKVDVPVLSPALIPESYLEVFETEFRYQDEKQKLYLTPSPELFLKRLLVEGIGDCYYLGKAFRNGERVSNLHSLEFTMLEYYKVGATYLQLADEVLEMMRFVAKKIYRTDYLMYGGRKISFKKWEKFTVAEAFEKFAHISKLELEDKKLFIKRAEKKGYKIKGFNYQDLFSQIIAQEVEPKLGRNAFPTLLYNYPKELSALAKLSANGKVAKRIEFYIDGVEVGGCCEELNDWKKQEKRFQIESKKRNQAGLINHLIDKGFIKGLKYGLPNCTGVGIGFDRLAMVFAGVDSIDKLKLINIR
jgi:elongation factor P--beta-lysine ligase